MEPTLIGRLVLLLGLSALILIGAKQIPTAVDNGTLQDLQVEFDVGSPSEYSDGEGPYYWIARAKSRFVLANNTSLFMKATLQGAFSVAPCNHRMMININSDEVSLLGEIGPGMEIYQMESIVSLRPFERRVVKLDLNGIGCQTSPSDGRVILSKISRVTLLKIKDN
jgi:hypothetical protein